MVVPVSLAISDKINWKRFCESHTNLNEAGLTDAEEGTLTHEEVQRFNEFVLAVQHATYAMAQLAGNAKKRVAGKPFDLKNKR